MLPASNSSEAPPFCARTPKVHRAPAEIARCLDTHRRARSPLSHGPLPALRQIADLDAVDDHQQIARLTCRQDFPFDTTRALELALLRAFAIPRISALLDQTGEFARAPQKRYDDTDILVSELLENGYDSPRGLAAIRRMNQLHGRFDIANADFLTSSPRSSSNRSGGSTASAGAA